MKLRQTLLGIVLSFSTVGIIATSADSQAYQEVFDQQKKQEVKVKTALDSEFISTKDQATLKQDLKSFEKAKSKETRKELTKRIEQEDAVLKTVQTNLVVEESKVAQKEHTDLSEDVAKLSKKAKEPFILNADKEKLKDFETKLSDLESSKKVKPVRQTAKQVQALSLTIHSNQKEAKGISADLKNLNKQSDELSKKKFLLEADEKELEKDRKENSQFFKHAESLEKIQKRKSESAELVSSISTKREKTETDFKDNETKTRELVTSIDKLIGEGKLTSKEKENLTSHLDKMNQSLALKNYNPGDLGEHYDSHKNDYDEYLKNSDKKIAEEKARAEKEAAEQAKRAEEEARQATENAQKESSVTSDGWHQAPAGQKYLKRSSGLTYGQVKNPGNFSLITDSEAANYRPGHGNGSAKQ